MRVFDRILYGTRLWSPEGADAGPAAGKTVRDDGGRFTNPGGDRERTDGKFLEWDNLGDRRSMKDDTRASGPSEPGVLPEEVEPQDAGGTEWTNPEGDRLPARAKSEKTPEPTDDQEWPDEKAAPGDGDGEAQAKPGETSESTGEDTADETGDDVTGILRKYQSPEALAVAFKNIQRLSTAQGKEKGKIESELASSLQELEDLRGYFDVTEDGTRALRPEKAVERLQQVQPPPLVDERTIRGQVEAELVEHLRKSADEDDVPGLLEQWKPWIDRHTAERVQSATQQVERHQFEQRSRAQAVVDRFFASNPRYNDKKIHQALDGWIARFPSSHRAALINSGMLPIGKIVEAEYLKTNLKAIVKEAYEKGRESGKRQETPPRGSAPSAGARAPRNRGSDQSDDTDLANSILRAGGLTPIESLFKD